MAKELMKMGGIGSGMRSQRVWKLVRIMAELSLT